MVRRSLITIGIVSLLALLLLLSGSWLIYSPSGTRWLLTQLPAWTGSELRIGRIEGTLGGSLQLEDIELEQPGLQLQLAHFSMQHHVRSWLPLALEIQQLRAEQLQLRTTPAAEGKPAEAFRWPETPWLLGLLQVAVASIELRDISWQQQDQQPQVIELLSTDLSWQDGNLQARQFRLQIPQLQTSGSLSCGLNTPLLQLDLQADSRDPATLWRQLQLKTDLQPGSAGQLVSGPAAFELSGAEGKLLTATAELGLTAQQLDFQQLQLSRPNRPGKLTASGSLQFSGKAPELTGQLQLSKLDLQAETGQPLQLSGSLQIKGGLEAYSGRFALKNLGSPLTSGGLAGNFSGDQQQLALSQLSGDWLSGKISGQARVGWQTGWQLQTELSASGIDPQPLHAQLVGRLNFNLQSSISSNAQGSADGRLQLQLQESSLHGQPVNGDVDVMFKPNHLQIEKLQLRGDGLLLQARGNPAERLQVDWQVERLEQLLSELRGRSSGRGWLRWRQETLATEFTADAEQLAFRDWQLGKVQLRAETVNAEQDWRLQLSGQQLQLPQPELPLERLELQLDGAPDQHRLTVNLSQQQSSAAAEFSGGWSEQQWRGELNSFTADDARIGRWQLQEVAPLTLSAQQLKVDRLRLRSDNGGELQLQGNVHPETQQGTAKLNWQQLDLALLRPWLPDWRIAGQSDGTLELQRGERNLLHASLTASGELQRQQLLLKLTRSELLADWDQQGLRGRLELELANGGRLRGSLTSAQAADFVWPKAGELQLTGSGFPLEMLHPWLPPALNITGQLGLVTNGHWRAGEPLNLTGTANAGAGRFFWEEEDGIISADISAAELKWHWADRLQGDLELELSEHGSIDSSFDLPLSASLPLALAPTAPVSAELDARLQELGLLSILFPGRIQESHGQLKLVLQLSGSAQKPNLQGTFHLFDAKAFLPSISVQLNAIELQGTLAENRIELSKLQLESGQGRLNGSGHLELQDWQPRAYQVQLKGKNFQLINLPELQVRANPDLMIDGSSEKVRVRGELLFPEVLISGKQKTALASNSPDLQIVDRGTPPPQQRKLQHDIDLQLILGERILLNSAGIDARLEGRLRLQSTAKQELAANGEIHVAKGKYASYGVSLDINRGYLYFTGGPLDQPILDIQALRKAGDVKAGVKVTGTPQAPIVQLYSEPVMPETDILSYIVLGRPIGAERNQTGLLMSAAGALLSQGESVNLQEKLKSRLGLDVLDISAGSGDVSSSVITTGKYLSPDLYVSLGYSLFSNSNELKVRYHLTPAWEIESNIGLESGVDMFYRIEIE